MVINTLTSVQSFKRSLTLMPRRCLLVGLLGEKCLAKFGYPEADIMSVLNAILERTKTKALPMDQCRGEECVKKCWKEDGEMREQLEARRRQRKIAVLRANVGKLLCICVPIR